MLIVAVNLGPVACAAEEQSLWHFACFCEMPSFDDAHVCDVPIKARTHVSSTLELAVPCMYQPALERTRQGG